MIKPFAIASSLLLLGSIGFLGACSRPVTEPRSNTTAQASNQEQEKPDKALQSFESIPGTPYLVANVMQVDWDKSRSSSPLSSDSYKRGGGDIRNLVFLDSGSLASHRLFETNQYNIFEAKQYPLTTPNGTAQKNKPTARFVYQIFKADTNQDKYIGGGDHRTIGISDAFGKQYVEVLTDISELLNLQPLSSDRLLAVYIKNGAKTASVIDLKGKKVLKTSAIAPLGPDVK
jgi:hypothetical protein